MERSSITVNGKSLQQIEKELRAPFDEGEMKKSRDGYVDIPIEAMEARMDSVIGVLNYNRLSSAPFLFDVNGAPNMAVLVTVEVYSDQGEIVTRKSACGSAPVIIINQTQNPKEVKSDLDSASSAAFKNVCKRFGVGIEQLRGLNKEKRENAKKAQSNTQDGMSDEKNLTKFRVKFLSRLSSGNKFYSADVIDLETGQKLKFMLFEKEWPLIEAYISIADFVKKYGPDQELEFFGYIKTFKETEQMIFQKPSPRG